MAGLFDMWGGGGGNFASGASGMSMPYNTLAGLGMGLMAGTVGNPYGAAMQGFAQGSNADSMNQYRQYQMRQAAEDRARQAQRDKVTDSFRERELALRDVPNGFRRTADGSLEFIPGGPGDPQYKRMVGDRQNAPPGYVWRDPNNPMAGMDAIPGGPAEKVDAEVAGRLGMARSWLGQLDDYKDTQGNMQPGLRKRIERGDLTTMGGAAQAWAGIGDPGETRRILDSGAEALLRMLTGAGMNKEEAANYVRRYQFSPRDMASPQTAMSKVNQLERELTSVAETVSRGRGGADRILPQRGETSSAFGADSKGGWTDMGNGIKIRPK